MENTKHIEYLKKKYPIEIIEKKFEQIEKLGYSIIANEYQCLIWLNNDLFVDADFFDDYYLNAADAIDSFFK